MPSPEEPEGTAGGLGAGHRARILVIALRYPPAEDAAAMRARNLVRNLQALGHEVRVITPRLDVEGELPPEALRLRWLDVEALALRATRRRPGSAGTMVPPAPWHRGLRSAAGSLAVPDLYAAWVPGAAAAAYREVQDADLVISTGGASAHIVARLVRGTRPAIVDINDLWWRKLLRKNGPIRERVDRYLERMIVRTAQTVIVPVREQGLEIERRWGAASTTIATGFDPSEFPTAEVTASDAARRELVFTGTLYTFPLDTLFTALAKGRDVRGWTPEQIRVSFIGSSAAPALAAARSRGLTELVDGTPRIPRRALLERLVAADVLLFPLFAEDLHHLPMRFFDFVGAGRPMLAIGSAHAPAAKLIREHGLGMVCETTAEIVAALDRIVSGPRPADLPPAARAPFETTNAQPALQELINSMKLLAGEQRLGRSVTT